MPLLWPRLGYTCRLRLVDAPVEGLRDLVYFDCKKRMQAQPGANYLVSAAFEVNEWAGMRSLKLKEPVTCAAAAAAARRCSACNKPIPATEPHWKIRCLACWKGSR